MDVSCEVVRPKQVDDELTAALQGIARAAYSQSFPELSDYLQQRFDSDDPNCVESQASEYRAQAARGGLVVAYATEKLREPVGFLLAREVLSRNSTARFGQRALAHMPLGKRPRLQVEHAAVMPEYGGKRVGSQLVHRVLGEQSCDEVEALVPHNAWVAMKFLEASGFSVEERLGNRSNAIVAANLYAGNANYIADRINERLCRNDLE